MGPFREGQIEGQTAAASPCIPIFPCLLKGNLSPLWPQTRAGDDGARAPVLRPFHLQTWLRLSGTLPCFVDGLSEANLRESVDAGVVCSTRDWNLAQH